jgi:uncharacterized protein (DUF362 family)
VASSRLARALGTTVGSAAGPEPSARPASSRAVVYRARREGILAEGAPHQAKLADALGATVARAAGEETPSGAMRRLFRPNDVVGIKLNCIAGKSLSPRPDLVHLLTRWLQEAGLPAGRILIWDRTDRELRNAGFKINRAGEGVRIFGTEKAYDWKPREWGPNASCFPRFLLEDLTALINVGVVKDHELAGVSLGLKNWFGAIHNPNKCHDNGCHPYVAHLANSPIIRDKLRLTILDGLTAQCHAGPARSPRWQWPYESVLVSTDPVAIDAVGTKVLEDRRKEVGLPSLADEKRPARCLDEAAKLGLGQADPARIHVEEV